MRRIIYTRMLQQVVYVTVTDDQYAALHQTEDEVLRWKTENIVSETARNLIDTEPSTIEWTGSLATDEDDEEVFHIDG